MMSIDDYIRMGADPDVAEVFVEAEAKIHRRDKEQAEAHTEPQGDDIAAEVTVSVGTRLDALDDQEDEDDPEV